MMKKAAISGIVRLASVYTLFATIVFSGSSAMARDHNGGRRSDKNRPNPAANDAWISGKLESAYLFNQYINLFDINFNVESGIVTLNGAVESDSEKELAGRIAQEVEGVRKVNNRLNVNAQADDRHVGDRFRESNDLGQWLGDASITALVKIKLAAERPVHSLDIHVGTRSAVVTLGGSAGSLEVRERAEAVARHTGRVRDVKNHIALH